MEDVLNDPTPVEELFLIESLEASYQKMMTLEARIRDFMNAGANVMGDRQIDKAYKDTFGEVLAYTASFKPNELFAIMGYAQFKQRQRQ